MFCVQFSDNIWIGGSMKDNKAQIGDYVLIVATRDMVVNSFVGSLKELRKTKKDYDGEMKGSIFDMKAYIVKVIDTPKYVE